MDMTFLRAFKLGFAYALGAMSALTCVYTVYYIVAVLIAFSAYQ